MVTELYYRVCEKLGERSLKFPRIREETGEGRVERESSRR